MGTTSPKNTPKPEVPWDSPHKDEIPMETPGEKPPLNDQRPDDVASESGTAPKGRYMATKTAFGRFTSMGDVGQLTKGIGHYSKTSMGGAKKLAGYMRVSTRAGAHAFGVFQQMRDGTDSAINEWIGSLVKQKASKQDIDDEIVMRIMPSGGSLDAVACRRSMARAMKELRDRDPNIKFYKLDDGKILELVESFLGYQAYHQISVDLGDMFENPTLGTHNNLTRSDKMRDDLKEKVSVQFKELLKSTPHTTPKQVQSMLQKVLEKTFLAYEESS